ncbi:hypothetical protein SBX64_11365 [Vibrio rhizosphaerae]|uniref:Uncharacterized protein n=1 Tax=Vibrio rhizosphaerae TaxID=398736 RepID=A0ABU4IV52_9VIBR|nr:hypothetical protein [Vibrio rhizosphaerae]MDW6093149.1 hypothetical protein [Vibrio rhizosphaerae]
MAINADTLEGVIIQKLENAGFRTAIKHAYAQVMVKAIAQAVVEHIQGQAEVNVTGGSSAGVYKVS